jgi:hypothetical protein
LSNIYGNELLKTGVYGIVDTTINKIVYIGSTNKTFLERWTYHYKDSKFNKHPNPYVSTLIKNKTIEFRILEITKNYTKTQLIKLERDYINKLNINGELVNIRDIYGEKLPTFIPKYLTNASFFDNEPNENRQYIIDNWLNIKITSEDRKIITKKLNLSSDIKFSTHIRKLGFIIQRFADKKHHYITQPK